MERVNAVGTVERRQPRKKGDVVVTTLRKEDNDQMESSIISTINKWAMTAPTNDYAHAVTDQLRGSHDGTDKTLPQYNKYWLELGRFAFLIGDYITATICSDKQRPKDPLPADPNTVGTFYQYKSLTPLNRVKDLHNNHMKFVNGPKKGEYVVGSYALLHDGVKKGNRGWSDPSNIRKCRVALRTLHREFCASEFANAYYPVCPKCIERNTLIGGPIDWSNTHMRRFEPCDTCTFQKVKPRGDPTYDVKCAARFQRVHNVLKNKHKARGALHMSSLQVRVIRNHLMSKGGDIRHLQLWTMLLTGIKLFLRAEEVCSIRLAQFRTDCFVVQDKEARVDQIVVWVKGKCDTEEQSLSIYRDDENPEFCLVRALLVYVCCAQPKGVYLFPPFANSKQTSEDSENTESHIEYSDLLKEIKVSFSN